MCGCFCSSDNPNAYRNKYKEKDKGICKAHPHMLLYSNFYWREYKDQGFVCSICQEKMNNNGCFHCRKCNYTLCPKDFYNLDGKISNDFQVGQRGQINRHKHILTYMDINSRNIPLTSTPTYKCTFCSAYFLMEYAESWNCPRCGYDICDKCFIENGDKIIQ